MPVSAAALVLVLPLFACPEPLAASATALPASLACEEGGAGVVLGDSVNLRAGPGVAYDIVGQIQGGSRVAILGEAFGWLLVRPETELKLYVSRDLVEPKGDGVAVVVRDRVNVRSRPALDGTVLGQVNRGDLVRIIDAGADFVTVAAPPDVGVYVHRDLVRRLDLTVEAGAPAAGAEQPAAAAPAPAPLTPGEKALRARDLYLAELDKADLDAMDFGPARRLYEEAARESSDPAVRALVLSGMKRLRVAAQIQADYRRRMGPIERLVEGR